MSTIKEICKKIKQELNIMTSDEKPVPEPLLKTEDIVPEHTWIKSGVTCLASRPSVGKSALAIDFILDAALREKKKVVVFSLELSSRQFVYRMLRRISGIYGELHMEDKPKLESAISYLEKLNIIITDTPGISIQETETELQAMKDVGMVVIDYIQLMCAGDNREIKNRKEEVRWIAKNLTRISQERQIPILILSQLTREIDAREDKRPRLEDLHRDLQPEDVDQVIFLYRDASYRKKEDSDQIVDDSAEIILAKSKSYSPKTIQVWFDKVPLCFRKK